MNWPSLCVCVKGHHLSSHIWVVYATDLSPGCCPQCPGLVRRPGKLTILGSCSQGYALAWALFSRKHFHNENTNNSNNKSITIFLTTRYVTDPAIGGLLISPPSFLSTIPCNRHHYPILHERKLNYFPHIQVKNRTQIFFIKEYAVITYLSFLQRKCRGVTNDLTHDNQVIFLSRLQCPPLPLSPKCLRTMLTSLTFSHIFLFQGAFLYVI